MRDKSQVVLPLNLEICIDKEDFVFMLAERCESLNYDKLFETYIRAWRKLNPITLFEIILFAYMERKFSSHQIVKCCRTDIRFMWLLNGQLKSGYNIQIGVEGEYIVCLGAFSNRTDVQTLIHFLNRIKGHSKRIFERIIADAGYESRENYLYLEENGQESYIKPTNYEISKTRKYKANPYSVENMKHDEKNDTYTSANGDVLFFVYEKTERTANGYEVQTRYYRNHGCEGCPHAGKCHRSQRGFREIKVSPDFVKQRQRSLENITTEEGTRLRVNRSIQVEGAFGILKQDFGFKRFLMRGKQNVETQFFLLAFAFNIEKLCNKKKYGHFGQDLFPLKAG